MTFGRACQGDGKQAVISGEKEVRMTGGREGAEARGSSRQKDNDFSWRTGSCEYHVDTSSQSQLQNFELEQVPSSWSRGSSLILGEEGEMGRMGFWGPVLPTLSCPWAGGEGTEWGSGLRGRGMSSHTLPHSRPNCSLSLPKVAQAGSLSPWKLLSIVKVQKIWKRRTVP